VDEARLSANGKLSIIMIGTGVNKRFIYPIRMERLLTDIRTFIGPKIMILKTVQEVCTQIICPMDTVGPNSVIMAAQNLAYDMKIKYIPTVNMNMGTMATGMDRTTIVPAR
jgi:hypothetical protein